MNKRVFVCVAVSFTAVLVAQPALGQVKLVGSSGNFDSVNPEDWTLWSLSPNDEMLYELSLVDGSPTFIRNIRNNVDAEVAATGWTAPFWGEAYRDGQHIAWNPDANGGSGLLYHRNGTTGYRDAVLDPRSYDTRLIETYDPGSNATFLADPVKVYNSLTDRVGGLVNDRDDPFHPIDGDIFGESRSFTYDNVNDWFILADNDGDIGHWDPTDLTAASSVHVATNAITHRGINWYDDGSATGRVFSGVNDESPGDVFWELDADAASGTYLEPLGLSSSITLAGAAGGAIVDQTIGMDRNPETGDLWSIVTLDTGGRHLIVYAAADIAAYNPATDAFIDAQYIGQTGSGLNQIYIAGIAFVPDIPPADNPDFNNDGWIDGLDYLIWAGNFGAIGTGTQPTGDANGDTHINGLDYLVWAVQFGTHPGPMGTAVPEPGTFALAALALVGLLVSRRRRGGHLL